MQLRFTSLVVINLWRDFHPQECAHAGRTQTALGRVGVPDDIGGVIASLLSDDTRWINAQRIEVSGGMFI